MKQVLHIVAKTKRVN